MGTTGLDGDVLRYSGFVLRVAGYENFKGPAGSTLVFGGVVQ